MFDTSCRVERITFYPLKSGAGVTVETARLEAEGLVERFRGPEGEARVRSTLRGRLLNDIVVERLVGSLAIQR